MWGISLPYNPLRKGRKQWWGQAGTWRRFQWKSHCHTWAKDDCKRLCEFFLFYVDSLLLWKVTDQWLCFYHLGPPTFLGMLPPLPTAHVLDFHSCRSELIVLRRIFYAVLSFYNYRTKQMQGQLNYNINFSRIKKVRNNPHPIRIIHRPRLSSHSSSLQGALYSRP